MVEDLRPRPHALVGLVAGALGLLAVAGVVGDVVPDADPAVAGRAAGRRGEVPAAGALAVEHQPGAVGAEAEVRRERELLLERRERARALEAEDAVLGRDVVGVGDQRRVGRVGHHQLDLVALGVVEDQRLRRRRVQAQQLAVVWLAIRRSIQYSSES